MHRIVRATSLAAVALALATSSASANLALNLYVPERLWDELASLPQIPPSNEVVPYEGRQLRLPWQGFAFSAKTTDKAIADARRYTLRDHLNDWAVVDRPLSATESRIFKVLPLYRDADVLLVPSLHPVCTRGLSLPEARRILRGDVRTWSALGVVGTDPAFVDAITLYVPGSATFGARPGYLGVTKYRSDRKAVTESSAVAFAQTSGSALVVAGFQLARPLLEREGSQLCAVPLGGVAPTVQTLTSRQYPATRSVGIAYSKALPTTGGAFRIARTKFLKYLQGTRGRTYLTRQFGDGLLRGWKG